MSAFRTLCHRSGLSRTDAIQLFGISPKTYHNWCNRGAPTYVTAALELITGQLDRHGFAGWTIRKGQLYSPAGLNFTPREIEMIPLHLAELAALRSANTRYRTRLPNRFRITSRPAANDAKRPERTPAFTDGHVFFKEPTRDPPQ